MTDQRPRGVIAAIPTPITAAGEPDHARFATLAARLLDEGCDGLNVLGTTGEATSFSVEQRIGLMRSVAGSGLDLKKMMVGTGASAIADAIRLTQEAARLGFGGALVLPPFYYKNVPADGVANYVERIAAATADVPVPIYLYNFPAQSGVPYTVELVERLFRLLPSRIAGLKDSSGDLAYARAVAAISPDIDVFPSTEAALGEAREGPFAGCISATANVNAAFCARALRGDDRALETAARIRSLFDGKPLVAGVKAILSVVHEDAALAEVLPPLVGWDEAMTGETIAAYRKLTG